MMGYGQFYTHRWGGEWSAGWHLMQVGPKKTLVIMQGTGEGLCQGLTTLQSLPLPHFHQHPCTCGCKRPEMGGQSVQA